MYNGYTNYETWLASMWLDNTHESYTELRKAAVDLKDDSLHTWTESLTDVVEHEVYKLIGTYPNTGMLTDIVDTFINNVSCREIARTYIAECIEPGGTKC